MKTNYRVTKSCKNCRCYYQHMDTSGLLAQKRAICSRDGGDISDNRTVCAEGICDDWELKERSIESK